MATEIQASPPSETAILARLIRPDRHDLTAAVAEAWLNVRFESHDLDRIHELLTGNQDDALTLPEREEMQTYLRVGAFLDLIHAKARRSQKQHACDAPPGDSGRFCQAGTKGQF
jgi:hypothetical protein